MSDTTKHDPASQPKDEIDTVSLVFHIKGEGGMGKSVLVTRETLERASSGDKEAESELSQAALAWLISAANALASTSQHIESRHIAVTPGIVGGKPRIAGHRITVQNVAIWHERIQKSVPPLDDRRSTIGRRKKRLLLVP